MFWSFNVCHYKATDPEDRQTEDIIVGILTVLNDDSSIVNIVHTMHTLNHTNLETKLLKIENFYSCYEMKL